MLEIDGDFAKKVAVPSLSGLEEIRIVLQESGRLGQDDVQTVLRILHENTQGRVNIAVKNVLDCIFEARADGDGPGFPETLADLLLERIQIESPNVGY